MYFYCYRCKKLFEEQELKNVECYHIYCLKCIQYYISKNGGICADQDCKQQLQLDKLVIALTSLTRQLSHQQKENMIHQKQIVQSDQILISDKLERSVYFGNKTCSICKNPSEALYNNPACEHNYCVHCLSYNDSIICLVKNCGWEMDQSLLRQFIEIVNNFMYESQKSKNHQIKILNQESAINVFRKANNDYLDDNTNSNLILQSQKFQELQKLNISALNLGTFVQLYENVKQIKFNFFDEEFPPTKDSLGGRFEFAWARAPDIFQGAYQFFAKDTKQQNRFGLAKWLGPDDIKQGQIGNCYLLAAIAAVGNRRPDLLLQNFVTQTVNEYGLYGIRLSLNGVWKVIYIDDYFPICYNQPVFAKPVNNAIWVMVIEKAWAKLYKSYQASSGGRIEEALKCLTGAPTEQLLTSDENFKQKLKNLIQQRAIIGASSQVSKQEKDTQGLVPNHAYSVLKFRTINHPTQNNVELIKLRNPWGFKEWQGDWSHKSPLWTDQLRKDLKLDQDRGGVFYMAYQQFIKQFKDIQVCHVRKNYFHESCEVQTAKNHAVYFKFDVKVIGEYYISLNQKSKRFPGNPLYSQAKLLLIKVENNSYQFIAGKTGAQIELWERAVLEAGSYIIYAKAEWLFSNPYTLGLQVYGPQRVILALMEKQHNIISESFLKQAKQQHKDKFAKDEQIECCTQLNKQTGFGYYYIQNKSNKIVLIKVKFTKFVGLKLRKPFTGNQINLQLIQDQDQIFILKISPKGCDLQISCSIN
ncbi:hypothetical protein pb186bvf_019790 [Paramecium bursaria]